MNVGTERVKGNGTNRESQACRRRNERQNWRQMIKGKRKNCVAWICERTIPTKRTSLVDEVSANFCGYRVPCGQRDGSLRPYSRISRLRQLLFLSSSFSVVFTRPSGIRSDPLHLRKSGSAGNRTRTSGSVAKNSDHQTIKAKEKRHWK
jgi:hypothetical protein